MKLWLLFYSQAGRGLGAKLEIFRCPLASYAHIVPFDGAMSNGGPWDEQVFIAWNYTIFFVVQLPGGAMIGTLVFIEGH